MLTTTIYDQSNACITGAYHSAKGDKIEVEYMGTAIECECYITGIRQDNEGSNEVQSVVIRKSTLWFNAPMQSNPLMTAWSAPVAAM